MLLALLSHDGLGGMSHKVSVGKLLLNARQKRNAAKKAYYDLAEEIKATNKLPKSIEDAYSLLDAVNGVVGEE